ncbi:MAG: hypothetical protein JAY75_07675 [Candidatus Thiodiazotropha taylori]|uniref:Uncharacterized protein n=1 Tax=Candidatus Thiodiazotropha taylori TaxID=2792791 RepID=A0A9E4NN95_9GAMM|nr:hypothetical protein [Candidatus Thiodiazotropha sp. (ex Lucina pensylvanica)]MCG7876594.1 hypothetical protein [Candidatus Thiodiazotropha taylori]MCW4238035.1 hypothetical protein [Candidatus Thiodiazotropha endolucinida]MBT3033264.1 hypothetical protein [Candidatus Thiodiazotropha sp. (ex Lucina pensylvanica)]MCG7891585.1 hypothetical protein [Candidatus Thiodiazotropha taylori]
MAKITTITEPWRELHHYLLGGEYRGPFYEVPTWRDDFYQAVFAPPGDEPAAVPASGVARVPVKRRKARR